MKKIAIAIIAAIALAGCASNTPAPTVTVTATPEAPAPAPAPVLTDEEVFIAAVENEYGPLTTKEEKQLIDFAYDICVSFDTVGVNKTLRYLVTLAESNREARMLGYIVGEGTSAFCPKYADELGIGVSA